MKYRRGVHFVWCSEHYDPATAPPSSPAAAIAPSASPKGIFDTLRNDCEREERHSVLIKNYRRTFCRLAAQWLAASEITQDEHDEIVTTVKAQSWRIWKPQLYVIPRHPIESAGRLIVVPYRERAAYGPELQIRDLAPNEFDIIESPIQ